MGDNKTSIEYIDRKTKKICREKVYGNFFLEFLYGTSLASKLLGKPLSKILAQTASFSKFFGWWQKKPFTKKNILPFIKKYEIDASEFAQDPTTFHSFNDFFVRHLKSSARPISPADAIIPADGRYLFYSNIFLADGFIIKGKKFSTAQLLNDSALAESYHEGAMLIARLCPTDYHRFHFPCDGTPGEANSLNGMLWSVNPLALKNNINIFSENKRVITSIETELFGTILYIEVGAKAVGSIHQTYQPNIFYEKGREKGYFSFGGSTLVLLFKKNVIQFDQDLLEASKTHIEIKCLLGQPMGRSLQRK